MSRFTDFDAFLEDKQKVQSSKHSQQREALLASRKKLDAIISEVFQSTKDYHETVILPRTDSVLILKKQEPTDMSHTFLYRANLVPTDFLPPAFRATDIINRVDYLNPKEVTQNDWHANVALQINLNLSVIEDSVNPNLEMTILVWGDLITEQSVLPHSISIKTSREKRTPYAITHLQFSESNAQRFITEFENLLMALTPYVLSHRDTVWKK